MAAQGLGQRTEALPKRSENGDSAGQPANRLRREKRVGAAKGAALSIPKGLRQTLERDEVLASRSGGDKRLYAIKEGLLASFLELDDGKAHVCALHFPGELLPVAWLPGERPVSVKAVTDAEVEVFTEETLCRFFREDSDGGYLFFDQVCDFAVRQREANCILRRLSVEGRLANFLLTLGQHLGVREGQRFHIALPMRRCEIANYLGLRSETLSRVFARWRAEGLIEPGELRQITFPDINRLEAVSRDGN
jgi:CRP/FNR family transcriptional regulator